jgi:hypothetical protein
MSVITDLTAEQRSFAEHGSAAFVHACPGAGKTRTIIARLAKISESLPARRGIAVLSFTNSAVDEFRERCSAADLTSLLKHPSFIGTLDGFVRQFVVLPGCPITNAVRPLVVDSWDRLGVEIRLTGRNAFQGSGVSLDLFDPETNVVDPERIGHAGLQRHVQDHQEQYEQAAASRRRRLLSAGYLSAADARVEALSLVRDQRRGAALGIALAARFLEVMVDEGQDCNPLDLEILTWLRHHGVRVTIVCDPDQAIYGFRHGNPADLRAFRESYPADSRLSFSGNFRSSPAICRLAATLRNDGREDQAVGDCAAVTHPVVLLAYSGKPNASIGRAFVCQIEALNLGRARSIVLAHAGKVAQRAASDLASSDSSGGSRVEAVARAVSEFWSAAASPRSREHTVQTIETLLLDLMGLRDKDEHLARALKRGCLDVREHRRRALNVLADLPRVCAEGDAAQDDWVACLQAKVDALRLQLPPGQTARGFLRKPRTGKWSSHLRAPVELGLRSSTIHEAKGHQYDAVCCVIPPNRAPKNHTDSLCTSWEQRTDAEAKRVLYVGVTRSRQLTVLAVPSALADRIETLLSAGGVPYVRQEVTDDG